MFSNVPSVTASVTQRDILTGGDSSVSDTLGCSDGWRDGLDDREEECEEEEDDMEDGDGRELMGIGWIRISGAGS